MGDKRQESRWVLRAQVGSREALTCLLKAVQEPLFRYLKGLVGKQTLAEDILQEVLVRIYQKLPWPREPDLFRPWCYRIATREAFRRLKLEKRWSDRHQGEELLAVVEVADENESPDQELLARLPELLELVSPASRAVLVLHYQNQLTLDEVADVLGIPAGTVKSRLHYGLTVLRRLVGGDHVSNRRDRTDG